MNKNSTMQDFSSTYEVNLGQKITNGISTDKTKLQK